MRRGKAARLLFQQRVARKQGDVFLRADFRDLGGYNQVGRSLGELVRKGKLMKLGQGLYTRVAPEPSPLSGKPSPVKPLRALATEALARLGVEAGPTQLDIDYAAGRTTQVPSGRAVTVNKRVRRQIGYNGAKMHFERARSSSR